MTDDISLPEIRRRYAGEIARMAGCAGAPVESALARVARENFLPAPPWDIIEPGLGVARPSSDPAELYRDVLVAIDAGKGINNGQPSLHAGWIAAVDPRPGETVIHVGCGGGYYTAVLAALVGPGGKVFAYEIEPGVGARAARALADQPNVEVRVVSGAAEGLPPADVIYVNAAAPAPETAWLAALRPGGRLVFPWATGEGADAAMLVSRQGEGFAAHALGAVRFIELRDAREKPGSGVAARRIPLIRSLVETARRPPDESAVAIFGRWWFSQSAP